MRSFRDGFGRQASLNRGPERPIPRSFRDGFGRPVMASGKWSPNKYSPAFWHDPTLLGQADESRIDTLPDQSSNENDLIKDSDVTRPYYEVAEVNGLDVMRFAHALNTRLSWTTPVVQAQPFTFFICLSVTSPGLKVLTGEIGADNIRRTGADEILFGTSGGAIKYVESATFSMKIFCFVANGANSKIIVDNSQEASGDLGSNDFTFESIGTENDDTDGWTGLVGDFFLVPSLLSDSQIQKSFQELANKWGITLS